MASTLSPLNQTLSLPFVGNATPSCCKAHATKPLPPFPINALLGRRQLLFFFTVSMTITTREPTAMVQDIPLFRFRKNLRKAEEAAKEIVREDFKAADKGLETAEKGIEAVEREISDTLSFSRLAHA
ncbi:hypothetical protein K1719_029208 [Acacia pycnantha]|nr:hypothetical protein K1719_029208 [Acacia pycnantha]